MPSVNTVVVRMHTPADPDTGERKRMIIETTSDYVFDTDTGQTIKEMIKERTYGNASDTEPGLMSSTQVNNLNTLVEEQNIFSEDQPEVPCMWFQIMPE